jgi:hypothetical protein
MPQPTWSAGFLQQAGAVEDIADWAFDSGEHQSDALGGELFVELGQCGSGGGVEVVYARSLEYEVPDRGVRIAD